MSSVSPDIASPTRLPVPSSASSSSSSSSIPPPRKDGNKRRSLLLPRGTIAASTQRVALPSIASPKLARPMTMMGDMQSLAALSAQFRDDDEDTETGNAVDARAAAHARLTGETNKSKIGISRSQATRKGIPGVDATGARSIRPPHGRNLSYNTGTSSRPLSTLVESKKLSRPPSVASTSSRPSPTESAAPSRSKLPATGLRRTASTASKHTRTQSALPTSSGLSSIALPRPTDVRRHPTISEGAATTRPAFSTLQQHYSPQKNGARKPASSTLIHAPNTVDPTLGLSLETQLLQARLLQLSILHRESEQTLQSWEQDARRKLHSKFDVVATKCGTVQLEEKEVKKNRNIHALQDWAAGDSSLLAEHVNVLANVVTEVMQLVETDGRVQGTLAIFEEWIAYTETIWETRRHHAGEADIEFIDSLGEAWRSEIKALIRRFASLGRVLDGLDQPKVGSSIRSLFDSIVGLIQRNTEELKLVLKVEADVVDSEKVYVDDKIEMTSHEE